MAVSAIAQTGGTGGRGHTTGAFWSATAIWSISSSRAATECSADRRVRPTGYALTCRNECVPRADQVAGDGITMRAVTIADAAFLSRRCETRWRAVPYGPPHRESSPAAFTRTP